MKSHSKFTASVISVTSATFLSRILGYLRDMMIANFFGAGLIADAYFVAYRIPNLLRRLLGEGALSASLIPVFTEVLEKKGEVQAREFVKNISRVLFFILLLLTIIGILIAPVIVSVIAPGFKTDPHKFHLTVVLTRIMFPFLMAISMAALAMGVLNALNCFFVPSLAPCFLSISEIAFILFICPLMDNPIKGLAIGVLVGGLAQLAFQLPKLFSKGFRLSLAFKVRAAASNPWVRKVGLLMLPAAWGLSIVQINSFVDTILATLLKEGSVAALYYSTRLYHLPLALFGTAVSTVTLPLFSQAKAMRKEQRWKDIFSLGSRMIIYTLLPATMGFVILGRDIIALLFERGAFDSNATSYTAWALLFYSLGLVFFGLIKILVAGFYSIQDTKTPVKVATLCCLINIVLNLILMRILGVGGLALATSIAAFANACLLYLLLKRKLGPLGGKSIMFSTMKILIITVLTGIFTWLMKYNLLAYSGLFARVFWGVTGSCLVYVILSLLFRCREIAYFSDFIFNRRAVADDI